MDRAMRYHSALWFSGPSLCRASSSIPTAPGAAAASSTTCPPRDRRLGVIHWLDHWTTDVFSLTRSWLLKY
jgi:hypothetical protein